MILTLPYAKICCLKTLFQVFDRVYQLVTQEERVRLSKHEAESAPTEAVGFAVRTGSEVAASEARGKGRNYDKPVCNKCRRTGHETSSCWADIVCGYARKRGIRRVIVMTL